MIAVLAGNYCQFMEWCRENRMHPNRDARYIYGRHSVQGMAFDERTRVGTYWQASDESKLAYEMVPVFMRGDQTVWGNC